MSIGKLSEWFYPHCMLYQTCSYVVYSHLKTVYTNDMAHTNPYLSQETIW